MNYKEALFFVAKCLTITHEEQNKTLVEKELKSNNIDWDAVVKVSTAHFVFPALYCNLLRADFLQYLPEELVNYMIHISDLNRDRNQQIIDQAKEINELLLKNNITPIFLKGTGNLLEGLYEDIAERMVGDIDFIVSYNKFKKSAEILLNDGYSRVHKDGYDPISFRHYPRLQKQGNISAIEIHKELLIEKYANEFNYNFVKKSTQQINDVTVMSFDNQLSLSIIAKQINDDGIHYKNISLRNAYDVYLLSKKTNVKKAFKKLNILQNPLNCFLAICYETFGEIASLDYEKTSETEIYLATYNKHLLDDSLRKNKNKKKERNLFLKTRFGIIYKSIFNKEYRNWLFNRIMDKNWQREKLVQLGLKKTKPNS